MDDLKCINFYKCGMTNDRNTSNGNHYEPRTFPFTWLEKEIWICGSCLITIIEHWVYDHVNKDGKRI